jgi:hypothetical protein
MVNCRFIEDDAQSNIDQLIMFFGTKVHDREQIKMNRGRNPDQNEVANLGAYPTTGLF